jgi:trehalose 6-phosphate phosphatase
LASLMATHGLDRSGVLVIYLGDDPSDEEAFRVLRHHGAGFGVRMGPPVTGTSASYYLHDYGELKQFLQSLRQLLPEQKDSEHL